MALALRRFIAITRTNTRLSGSGIVTMRPYLSELRLDRAARGRLGILRGGYNFFHALQQKQPAAIYFTSIAADNHRARRLLECDACGLPTYRFLTDFVTLVVAVPRFAREFASTKFRFETATLSHVTEIVALLNQQASQHQLASEWTEQRLLSLARHGLALHDFQLAFAGKRLIACAGLWDQRAFRQTVVRG